SDVGGRLRRALKEFSDDRIPSVAGGITFFTLIAMFPALASVVSLYGLFADPSAIAREVQYVARFLPEGGVRVLNEELPRLTAQGPQKLGGAFGVGFLIALWSASGGFSGLIDGLNIAYEARETRGIIHRSSLALLFTLLAIGFSVVAVGVGVTLPTMLDGGPLGDAVRATLKFLSWPLAFCFCNFLFAIMYRFGPAHRPAFRAISYGSVTAAALWVIATVTFKWYARNFGSFDRVYGSLGGIVGFLTWLWLSITIFLLGAELNSEFERDA
ncbi:MAG: YihY/virulence factor BrkB family protein, partial [Burkholderiales bacterium]